MDAHFQRSLMDHFADIMARTADFGYTLKLRTWTGSGGSDGDLYGEDVTYSTGSEIVYQADVSLDNQPRYTFDGVRSAQTIGRAKISAEVEGRGLDVIQREVSLASGTTGTVRSARAELLVGSGSLYTSAQVTSVHCDNLARVLTVDFSTDTPRY